MRIVRLLLITTLVASAPLWAIDVLPADSPVKIDLYGVVLANAYWNSSGVVGSDVPLWTVSGADLRVDDHEFGIIARQTRFGFKVKAPDVGSAKLSGVLEADFFGGFPASGQAASFPDLRLRLGYVKLDWTNVSLTAGQDWIILAPLNPSTLSHFAVVGYAASGNLWLRYPQVRIDVTHPVGDSKLGFTAGIIRPVSGSDVPIGGTLTDTSGAGERSGMPFWQGRVFYTKPIDQKALTLGFSGHYGKENYKLGTTTITEKDLTTWAVAGDFVVPIGKAVSVQGEMYTGSNLDSFMGGINQGFKLAGTSFADATDITAIDTAGGWIQLSVTPPSMSTVTFNVSYGVDNPDDKTLAKGQRSENSTWMGSVICKPSKYFQTAFEYSRISTKYYNGVDNDANVINVAFGLWF